MRFQMTLQGFSDFSLYALKEFPEMAQVKILFLPFPLLCIHSAVRDTLNLTPACMLFVKMRL